MMILLILLAMGSLAIQISYESTLAYEIKKALHIHEVPKIVKALSKLSFWNKLLSKWLFPINLSFSFLFSIYSKLIEMIQCPYCLSFWLGSVSTYLYGESVLDSILYGLVTIIITKAIEKLTI